VLTSLQNPLVKQIRKLHRTKERHATGLFLLEGTHLIEEACAMAVPLTALCYTPVWQQAHLDLLERAKSHAQRLELVSPELLQAMSTTVHSDGVVAIAPRQPQSPLAFHRLGLVLEAIQDPGNLGTMIRTAAAAGAEGILVSADSVDLDHPKVLRASAGQWFRLPLGVSQDLPADLTRYRAAGMQVVATLPRASQTYWDIDFQRPTVVVMGNEGAGLSASLAEVADVAVSIPLAAGVESLNVAIATALILYEAQRQRPKLT
jgi:TrmH family RNA methyltransferase